MRLGVAIGELRMARGRPIAEVAANLFEDARRADSLGFDAVWVNDHMIYPAEVDYTRSHYPGTATGRNSTGVISAHSTLMEPLTELAAVAGVTSRVKLGTKVLV